MPAPPAYFFVRKGEAFSRTIVIRNATDTAAQDLTGWAVAAEGVANDGDATPVVTYTCVVTDAAAGTISVTLSSATILAMTIPRVVVNLMGTPSGGSPEELYAWTMEVQEARTQ